MVISVQIEECNLGFFYCGLVIVDSPTEFVWVTDTNWVVVIKGVSGGSTAKRVGQKTTFLGIVWNKTVLVNAFNARKLSAVIVGKDLTKEVGSLLPAKASYK